MRYSRLLFLFAAVGAVATASNETLPRLVAEDVRTAMHKAEAALGSGDKQFALALYEGALYPDGITVAIDQKTVRHEDDNRAVYHALSIWNDELKGDFPVTLEDKVEDADITIRFVDTIPERGHDALGVIRLEKRFKWSSRQREIAYTGTISVVRSLQGERLSMAETRDVVLHELGHLLGLGDTDEIGLIMGPMERGRPLARPTAGEVEDVKALRRTLRERIKQVSAQK